MSDIICPVCKDRIFYQSNVYEKDGDTMVDFRCVNGHKWNKHISKEKVVEIILDPLNKEWYERMDRC